MFPIFLTHGQLLKLRPFTFSSCLIQKNREKGNPLHFPKYTLRWSSWLLALLEMIHLFIQQIDTEFLSGQDWYRSQGCPDEKGITPFSKSLQFPRKRDGETGSSNDLPNPGIKSRSPTLQADSLPSELPGKPNTSPPQVNSLHDGNTTEGLPSQNSGCHFP